MTGTNQKLREAFEREMSKPPFEFCMDRWPDDGSYAWPGNYAAYHTQCAWAAWQARAALSADDAVDGPLIDEGSTTEPSLHPVAHIELGDDFEDVVTVEQAQAYATAAVQQYKVDAERWRMALNALYLEYVNNYLTVEKFAEHQGLTTDQGQRLIDLAREIHNSPHPES